MPRSNHGRISRGSRVSGKIGPFQGRPPVDLSLPPHQQQRRPRATRVKFHGTVVGSSTVHDGHFRVHWDECNKTSDHMSRHLEWIDNPEQLNEEQNAYFKSLFENDRIYIGVHKDMMRYTVTTALISNQQTSRRAPPLPPPAPANVPRVPPLTAATDLVPTTAARTDVLPGPRPAATDVILPPEPRPTATDVVPGPTATDVAVATTATNDILVTATDVVPTTVANVLPLPSSTTAPEEPLLLTNGPNADPAETDVHHNPDPDNDPEEDVLFDETEVEAEMRENEINNSHIAARATYLREKGELVRDAHQVLVKGPRHHQTVWTVSGDVEEANVDPHVEFFQQTGVVGFDFREQNRTVNTSEVINESGKTIKRSHKVSRINFLDLFRHLFGDNDNDEKLLDNMNKHRKVLQEERRRNNSRNGNIPIRLFTRREFWVGWGLVLASRCVGRERGEKMWDKATNGIMIEVTARSFVTDFNPAQFMSLERFKEWKTCVAWMYADEAIKDDDPWWQISPAFEAHRRNRKRTIALSIIKVLDESMSAFRPQTKKDGNVPHLSFIKRKPEPLGIEVKVAMCCMLLVFLNMNLCRSRKKGDEAGEDREYDNVTPMKTVRVSLSLMKESKVDRTNPSGCDTNPNATRDVFLGDAWFSSVDLAVKTMQVHDSHYIGVVKMNSSKYPKRFLEETMKMWPAGSHLNLEATVDGVPLVATGYKYCKSKVIAFIWTKGAGHTEPGDPYIAKWHDSKSNRCERWIDRPSIVAFYFNQCNGIDVGNMMRQKVLRLEKSWVTQNGYFRLLTTLVGTNVVDTYRAYMRHCRCNHRHKKMQLMEFTEMLCYDMLKNELPNQDALDDSFSLPRLPPAAPTFTQGQPNNQPHNHHECQLVVRRPQQYVTRDDLQRVVDRLNNHKLCETTERERNGTKWRLKRRRCSTKGCKCKTTMYCPACIPGPKRDLAWMCKRCGPMHEREHTQNILELQH